MAFQRIMGLNIVNQGMYQQYREAMLPILQSFGGDFGFDFTIDKVLKSKENKKINRVFTIDFPSKKAMENFFSDPQYLQIKELYLLPSVDEFTVIALHEISP